MLQELLISLKQEMKGVASYDSQKPSSDEAALLPHVLVSGQEMLPLLSAIAEVGIKHQTSGSLEYWIKNKETRAGIMVIYC